jgi:cellulose synthase/poly-beta-1,6-N-acetylglucosamine synthase-like glycosyltransferase
MYFGALVIFIIGMASFFYKEKEDKKASSEEKLVSIIIPAHNEEKVVRNILHDLVVQSYSNFEVLLISHNSSDKTAEKARMVRDKRIKVIEYETEESGKSLALNKALALSKGEIILHFDTDNRIKDYHFISKVVAHFENPDIDGLQTRLNVSNLKNSFLAHLQKVEFEVFSAISLAGREVLNRSCILAGTGIALRKELVEEMGGWNNSLVEDFEFFTRLSLAGKKIVFADNLEIYDEKPTTWSELLKQRSRWFKGHVKVGWENLHNYGNFLDYFYRLIPFSVLAWWVSIFLYIFYFTTGQFSVWDIGNKMWVIWTFGFQIMPLFILWKIGGFKKTLFLIPQIFFSFHWMITAVMSVTVNSWSQTMTNHNGGN